MPSWTVSMLSDLPNSFYRGVQIELAICVFQDVRQTEQPFAAPRPAAVENNRGIAGALKSMGKVVIAFVPRVTVKEQRRGPGPASIRLKAAGIHPFPGRRGDRKSFQVGRGVFFAFPESVRRFIFASYSILFIYALYFMP